MKISERERCDVLDQDGITEMDLKSIGGRTHPIYWM